MISFRKNMYVSESIKNLRLAKWKLRTGRGQFNLYLIVFNHDSKRLEYFHNGILKQRILLKMDYDVIGLAKSEGECIEIISNLINETYRHTGKYDVSAYIDLL